MRKLACILLLAGLIGSQVFDVADNTVSHARAQHLAQLEGV